LGAVNHFCSQGCATGVSPLCSLVAQSAEVGKNGAQASGLIFDGQQGDQWTEKNL
jgi:hypothetical protein